MRTGSILCVINGKGEDMIIFTLSLILVLQSMVIKAWAAPQEMNIEKLAETPMKWVPTISPDIILTNGFRPHSGFKGTKFRIEPIHRNHSPIDYKAWHDESWNELRVLYGQAWDWPREISESQNAEDLEKLHYEQFLRQDWISYEVLSLEGDRALGSIYITPQSCGAYGAFAMYWITTPMRQGIEGTFHAEVKQWLNTVWPWGTTYFPGPEVSDKRRGQLYQLMEKGICI